MMGAGAMISASKKLCFITRSSIETDVIPRGEHLPKCAWFRCVRIDQGRDDTKEGALMQDNKSCTLLHKNYLLSTHKGTNTKNTRVRYFLVVEKLIKRR